MTTFFEYLFSGSLLSVGALKEEGLFKKKVVVDCKIADKVFENQLLSMLLMCEKIRDGGNN